MYNKKQENMKRKYFYTICYVLMLAGIIGSIANTYFNVMSRRPTYIACMTMLFVGLIGTNAIGFVEAKGNSKRRKLKAGMMATIVAFFIIFLIEITTA